MNSRLLELQKTPDESGKSILYIMSRDQRVRDNHALLEAQAEAFKHKLPLIVGFILLPSTGYRRREQYQFMIDGLTHVEKELKVKNIPFVIRTGSMLQETTSLCDDIRPRSVYFDFSPLRGPRHVQKTLAERLHARVVVVDTHNIIPAWVLSDHEEFAAHTIRRKIHKAIEQWCMEPDTLKKHPYTLSTMPSSVSWKDVDDLVARLPSSGIDHGFTSGETAAHRALQTFIETGLDHYADKRNDASRDNQSNLSPYLHFGQISSLRIVLELFKHSEQPPQIFRSIKMPSYNGDTSRQDGIDAFVEELVVRKELADNYCFYQPDYDNLAGAKDWAKETLKRHADDPRETMYSFTQLESAKTHDELWNAAQNQLVRSGKIHGYMRMYWAKKILEWTKDSETAIKVAIQLNDIYHLDGGDPNGYVGIMWSIAGVHDRPWFDRDIFGKIRYMSSGGIAKKFDTKTYSDQWRSITDIVITERTTAA